MAPRRRERCAFSLPHFLHSIFGIDSGYYRDCGDGEGCGESGRRTLTAGRRWRNRTPRRLRDDRTPYLDLVRTAEELTGKPPAEFQTQTVAGAADTLKLPW